MVGRNGALLSKLLTAARRLSDQASRTSSRARSGTRADRERMETKRRSARAGGTGKIEAYSLYSLFPLASKWISILTPTPRPQRWAV